MPHSWIYSRRFCDPGEAKSPLKRCFDRSRRRWNVLENEIRRFVPGVGGKTCNRIAGLYFNRLLLRKLWCQKFSFTEWFFFFFKLSFFCFLATFNCYLEFFLQLSINVIYSQIKEKAEKPSAFRPVFSTRKKKFRTAAISQTLLRRGEFNRCNAGGHD